ncbi:hypothetical protein LGL55_19785 [Clostridium tagluense]|uniref:hypothetical protein n=1 Tax=Clostridium tagluense TaxID=360422 RepID=UPI001CF1E424|nr:hypothetical protein [Clostridium tagluense]MCB2313368.1 hypothetical protein [Clostridium tagluense]MCB2318192.1 hypothetical protein [Clostridium tagluense]MCB2322982.1 hypothetical protein [Clostridium tagluense]MCB2327976.1 hypothetical protein [Clostridium tagluense]MCB2332684.1 hypothetical protein [Clostridium tagluense]
MNELEVIEYWKSLIKDEEFINIWEEILEENDPLRKVPEGFFSMFRPNGTGLNKVFKGTNKGDEILKRVLEIYEATSEDYDGSDWYFVVRKPKITSKDNIESIAKGFLYNVIEMAKSLDDEYFYKFINNPPKIQVIEGTCPKKVTDEYSEFDFDIGVYELMHNYMDEMIGEESDAVLFREPLYQIACRYEIVYYVLWPLYKNESEIEDLFKPFIELWKVAAKYSFDIENNILNIWIPWKDEID